MRGYFFAYFWRLTWHYAPRYQCSLIYIGDSTGRPLDAGKVYFGDPNKDPELYPIDVYYDEALTIAAPQPIRTKGGFLMPMVTW